MYGRQWDDLTKHIGTRLRDGVKSHAQKHFIHLWLDNKALPDKVRESGAGHTLSGNPLNPESAAVRPYLKSAKRRDSTTLPPEARELTLEDLTKEGTSEKTVSGKRGGEERSGSAAAKKRKEEVTTTATPHTTTTPTPTPTTGPPSTADIISTLGIHVGTDGKTEYSRNRPRREITTRNKHQNTKYAEDGYDLLPCPPFRTDPTTGLSTQPYTLTATTTAIAIIDLHSHLLDTEVVGLLAGTYDPTTNECNILTSIPATRKKTSTQITPQTNTDGASQSSRATETTSSGPPDDASISVEASEESIAAALATAEQSGLAIVGWYHSHPVFATNPSRIDCETQEMHQRAFCDLVETRQPVTTPQDTTLDTTATTLTSTSTTTTTPPLRRRPFLGGICGPYAPDLPTAQSELTWFIVPSPQTASHPASHSATTSHHPPPSAATPQNPRKLVARLTGHTLARTRGIECAEVDKMVSLIRTYAAARYDMERHVFGAPWRVENVDVDVDANGDGTEGEREAHAHLEGDIGQSPATTPTTTNKKRTAAVVITKAQKLERSLRLWLVGKESGAWGCGGDDQQQQYQGEQPHDSDGNGTLQQDTKHPAAAVAPSAAAAAAAAGGGGGYVPVDDALNTLLAELAIADAARVTRTASCSNSIINNNINNNNSISSTISITPTAASTIVVGALPAQIPTGKGEIE
ncbi:hypothetical protein DFJ77DRAFT_182524 [Powellomyces hirtus]|nr:hypothetical protein DFJ77DRAFT_182524 [Powellomyces hirtus]